MRQIVLDTETTGLEVSDGNRIIEIGCVELLHRQQTGHNLHIYVNPERDSEEGALKVHGLTTAFLRDKPVFADIAQRFLDYVQGAELLIHNAAFDVKFLNHELKLAGFGPLESYVASVTDTLALAKELLPGRRHSLDALCTLFDVDRSGRTFHGALLDSELLAQVYINLTRKQESLLGDDGWGAAEVASESGARMDFSGMQLPVLRASADEVAAHAEMLKVIDKASGDKTVWKKQLGVAE